MSILRIYARVLGLLAPEKWLAIGLALANLAIAGVFFLEPWLFGHVVDSLAAAGHARAWQYIGWWAAVGFGGIGASVLVSLHADRLAHRRRLAAISLYFGHAIALPLSFHGAASHRTPAAHHVRRHQQPVRPVAEFLPRTSGHAAVDRGDGAAGAADELEAGAAHDRPDDGVRHLQLDRDAQDDEGAGRSRGIAFGDQRTRRRRVRQRRSWCRVSRGSPAKSPRSTR